MSLCGDEKCVLGNTGKWVHIEEVDVEVIPGKIIQVLDVTNCPLAPVPETEQD